MTLLGNLLHQGCERQVTPGGIAGGLFAGAMLGAALTTIGFSAAGMAALSIIAPVAFVAWLLGLAVIAAPGWWLLHRLGARCQTAATLYGGGLTGVVAFFAFGGSLPVAVLFAAAGALVGALVGWLAYPKAV